MKAKSKPEFTGDERPTRLPKAEAAPETALALVSVKRLPTDAERAAIAAAAARASTRPARLTIHTDVSDGQARMGPTHSDVDGYVEQIRDTFGSSSNAFCSAASTRLDVMVRGPGEECAADHRIEAALAVMAAVAPANELEAIIGEQIIGAHMLSIEMMEKARQVTDRQCMEAYINMATKLSRTMAAQVDTLSRLRSGGKQQVIVKHVYINGNAFVGDNAQAVQLAVGGGSERGTDQRNIGQSRAADVFDALGPPLRSEDALGLAVPLAGREGPEAVPDARRHEPRRTLRRGERPVPQRASHKGAAGGPVTGAQHGSADQEHVG